MQLIGSGRGADQAAEWILCDPDVGRGSFSFHLDVFLTFRRTWWKRGVTGKRAESSERSCADLVMKHVLLQAQRHVTDLYEDLRDGHNLISLLEVLSGETLPREKGRMRFHKLQNVQIALDFLKHRQVKLVNIRNDDIADGNPKLTLGLIWTIILHFQVPDSQLLNSRSVKSKELYCQRSMPQDSL
uniref:Calponin-homology (CH) domain-containing protein n=1 Tax=Poecilia reticulata TaxID=8081 RepID=A0A3P9PIW1_POERE